jgi:site-specific DNA-methyltransferase (adenine-specific)
MSVQLLQGDCLELMRELPDGSVDAVICDLPYGTTACAWDAVIPFEPLWAEYKRVIKPRGAVVLFGAQPFTTMLIASNLAMFKYCWIWDKKNKTDVMNAKNKPLRRHEEICVFSTGTTANCSPRRMQYFPQGITKATRILKLNRIPPQFMGKKARPSHLDNYAHQAANYPSSIIEFSNADRRGVVHPTQKPVALLEYLIRTYTSEGEMVLDNCFGSGTTGVACVNTRRDFIGMELDATYFNIARERIEAAQQQQAFNLEAVPA